MASKVQSSAGYRPDIDGLRAIAIILVVVFHGFPSLMPGGFVGVDVFFVISGFLITNVILGGFERGSFSCVRFYANRVCRLFPALIVVMIFCLVAGWLVLLPDEYENRGKHVAASSVYVTNFVLLGESGYFDVAAELKPLLHLWSLAIEEQFYLVWPVTLLLVHRSRIATIAVTVAGLFASFMANVLWVDTQPAATYFLPTTRIWELLIGVLLATITRPSVGRSSADSTGASARANVLAIAGLGVILTSAVILRPVSAFPGWWALLPTLGTALLILSPSSWLNRWILSHRTAVFVGLIAYPLYLWHWPLLSFARVTGGGSPTAMVRVGIIVASVVLAVATYRFIETPQRSGRLALVLAAACLVTGVAGYAASIGLLKPYSSRLGVEAIVEAVGEWAYPTTDMELVQSNGKIIWRKPAGAGSVIFFGDSNAEQYWPRIQQVIATAPEDAKTVYFMTGGGCPPIPAVVALRVPYCQDFVATALAYIDTQRIDTVVLAAQWWRYFDEIARGDYLVRDQPLEDPAATDKARQSLQRMMKDLVRSGHTVYLVLNVPVGHMFDPKSLITRSPMSIKVRQGGEALTEIEGRHGETARRLTAAAAEAGATVIDPIHFLCSQTRNRCPATTDDGMPMYKDSAHLRPKFVRSSVTFLDGVVKH